MIIQRSSSGKNWNNTSEDWLIRTLDHNYANILSEYERIVSINKGIVKKNEKIDNKKEHNKLLDLPEKPVKTDELLKVFYKARKGKIFYPLGKDSIRVKLIK